MSASSLEALETTIDEIHRAYKEGDLTSQELIDNVCYTFR